MSTVSIQELKRPAPNKTTGYVMSQETAALRQRAPQTVSQETGFIANPTFHDQADVQFNDEDELVKLIERGGSIRVATGNVAGLPGHLARLCETPLLSREEERALFRQMNLLKFKANSLRCVVNVESPDVEVLDEIDHLLLRAGRIRDHIVQANLRLVMSIAKKFADSKNPFDELLSEGISAMMRAVEKFDYDRGFRFSTYTTRAVRRDLSRLVVRAKKQQQRFSTNATEYLDSSQGVDAPPEAPDADVSKLHQALFEMMQRLNPREQFILRNRFELNIERTKATYLELGEKLGVSKERARQLTERALEKLRAMAPEYGLEATAVEV